MSRLEEVIVAVDKALDKSKSPDADLKFLRGLEMQIKKIQEAIAAGTDVSPGEVLNLLPLDTELNAEAERQFTAFKEWMRRHG